MHRIRSVSSFHCSQNWEAINAAISGQMSTLKRWQERRWINTVQPKHHALCYGHKLPDLNFFALAKRVNSRFRDLFFTLLVLKNGFRPNFRPIRWHQYRPWIETGPTRRASRDERLYLTPDETAALARGRALRPDPQTPKRRGGCACGRGGFRWYRTAIEPWVHHVGSPIRRTAKWDRGRGR